MLSPARAWRYALPVSAGIALLAACLAAPVPAQLPGGEANALRQARREAQAARQRADQLEAQAAQASDAADRLRARSAAIAVRIVAAEADMGAATARIRIVAALRAQQRARLAARQQPIVRLAAGLQTMARRPAALALVQRGSIADIVHVRAVLAAQLPVIRARTAALRQEVAEGLALQTQADRAADALRQGQRQLGLQRAALAQLEARHRTRALGLTDSAMREEDRATALAEQARDIVDLMGRIGVQADVGRRLAALPGPMVRPPIPGFTDRPASETRVRLPYRLPVSGRLMTGLGEISDAGLRARGLTILPRAGALVVAPAAGRIAYAGPYRDYARIVIIDHGRGLTSLVTNLATLTVAAGDRVTIAQPLGRAGGRAPAITVELKQGRQPIDIVPLLGAG